MVSENKEEIKLDSFLLLFKYMTQGMSKKKKYMTQVIFLVQKHYITQILERSEV